MKILIISGFLGAGKTTFIKELVKQTKKKFVILENEMAELSLDSDILKEDDLDIYEVIEGCVCCSTKADFKTSILTIANTLDPEYLIIEPTGVGLLSNIIENIKMIEYERIQILAPITIIDYNDIENIKNDIYKDQLINASKIIISKSEQADKNELKRKVEYITGLGAKGEIISNHYSKMDTSWWNDLLNKAVKYSSFIKGEQDQEYESVSFKGISFNDSNTFFSYLNVLLRGDFGIIVRAKGIFKLEDEWIKLDIVQKKYTIEASEEIDEPKLIIIGQNLQKDKISILLNAKIYKKVELAQLIY